MKKEIIYSLKGIYREDYQIEGYRFGGGEKSACIVGALREMCIRDKIYRQSGF